jgi:dihydrodipicolinate synthase/N-acetylneuraminate lyase
MTGNQVVSTMFDFNTCIHMVRFVLLSGGDEDPGYFLIDPGCVGVYSVYYCIDPHCMSGGYVQI